MNGPVTPQMPKGSDLAIRFRVIANGWQDENKFKAELILTNNAFDTLGNNWTIYFNFLRKIDSKSVSSGADINHINGDLFSMAPSGEYTALGPGESLTVTFIADFWAIKTIDAPSGFYLVNKDMAGAEMKPQKISDFTVAEFIEPEQTTRCSDDKWPVPTAYSRFAEGEYITEIDPDSFVPVLPTPQFMEIGEGSYPLSGVVAVCAPSIFEAEVRRLQQDFMVLFGIDVRHTENIREADIVLTEAALEHPEAYTIDVTVKGIAISGVSDTGIFYALSTLLQVVAHYRKDLPVIMLPAMSIRDRPLLSYRGLHLDVARNFQKTPTVKKLLGLMSRYKLNHFHFHLTDDEGWRLEIPGLPELTDTGSRRGHTHKEDLCLLPSYGSGYDPDDPDSPGNGFYSRQEFIDLIRFAHSQHIRVIPAIDIPGHARAAIVSMNKRYRRYMEIGDQAAAEEYLLADPADDSVYESVQMWRDNVVNIGLPSVYRFISKITEEIVSMFHEAGVPFDTMHIGGDEVPPGVWEQSPAVQKYLEAHPDISGIDGLSRHFIKKVSEILRSHGLQTAGWEEVAIHGGTIHGSPDIIPWCWNTAWGSGGEKTPYQLANAGYQVVMCNAPSLYFDFACDKSPDETGFYWGGFNGLKDVFSFDPFDVYGSAGDNSMGKKMEGSYDEAPGLNPDARSRILGIQGQLWGETLISAERLEYMLLPRMLALAERAWSPAGWTNAESRQKAAELRKEYSIFAHKAGLFHFVWIDKIFGFTNVRIPPCGIKKAESMVHINNVLPGLQYRYTLDGSEPDMNSMLYTGPFSCEGKIVRVKAFSSDGRHSSRVSTVSLT